VITLLLLLSTPAQAEDTGACAEFTEVILDATYIEGRGCVVEEIAAYCDRVYEGVCPTWSEVRARYGGDADRLLTCEDGGTVANRNVVDATSWYLQEDFDSTGRLIGALTYSYGDTNDSYCCDGVASGVLRWGDSDGECTPVAPTDTADTADTADTGDTADTSKTGPCGCASDTGGAAALLAACSLLTVRRRRQP
jgi:hypothetical protein